MQKRDFLELTKRFTKEKCTFTKMAGCFVGIEKQKVLMFNRTFLNLEDEEFYKYLELAKKGLSGIPGDNQLELDFRNAPDDFQKLYHGLVESGLKDEGLLERFYDLVIAHYDHADAYLILLFHDAYDVVEKGTDQLSQGESEYTYAYVLGLLCPVKMTKPGLGYLELTNEIGPRHRDRMVHPPETAFLFPAFNDRIPDDGHIVCYARDPKNPHMEFAGNVLGTTARETATMKRTTFSDILSEVVEDETEIYEIQQEIAEAASEREEDTPFDEAEIQTIVEDAGTAPEAARTVAHQYQSVFKEERPTAKELVDEKYLKKGEETHALKKEIAELKGRLGAGRERAIYIGGISAADVEFEEAAEGQVIRIRCQEADRVLLNGRPLQKNPSES